MAVYYLDPIGGNNSNDGTSFANRRKSYPSSASNAFQDGDEVRIIKSPDYTSLGNATWKAKPKGTFYDESNTEFIYKIFRDHLKINAPSNLINFNLPHQRKSYYEKPSDEEIKIIKKFNKYDLHIYKSWLSKKLL